jgi:hypothetical protein
MKRRVGVQAGFCGHSRSHANDNGRRDECILPMDDESLQKAASNPVYPPRQANSEVGRQRMTLARWRDTMFHQNAESNAKKAHFRETRSTTTAAATLPFWSNP